mmetsp:Transcript_65555/g.168732  ORF Transcript_65555/g.168732 Transcript_65555/m.168732 type:complete len:214 (+) Transcript_65555:607-1248(+)
MATLWWARLTGRRSAFAAPAALAAATRASTFSGSPPQTRMFLEGSSTKSTSTLLTVQPTERQSSSTSWRPRPTTLHMAPGRHSSSAARPFSQAKSSAVEKDRAPANTSAGSSPAEKPSTAVQRAIASGLATRRRSTAAKSARRTATTAEALEEVSACWSRAATSKPSSASASSSICLTAGSAEASRSMPAYCEPCPGSMSATEPGTGTPGFAA